MTRRILAPVSLVIIILLAVACVNYNFLPPVLAAETVHLNATVGSVTPPNPPGGGGGGGGPTVPVTPIDELEIIDVKIETGLKNAKINWKTNQGVTSELKYGYSFDYELATEINREYNPYNTFNLINLKPNTRYYFRLVFVNVLGKKIFVDSFFETKKDTVDDILNPDGDLGDDVCPRPADINRDKRVNLVDFSILLYNFGNLKNQRADLNCDKKVDLADFSILLYYWQG